MEHRACPFDLQQDIEAAVLALDRSLDDLSDWDVLTACEALLRSYHALSAGQKARLRPMSPLADAVFETIKAVGEQQAARAEVLAVCLRQLRQSLRFWNKQSGRRGYLEFLYRERGADAL